MADAKQHNWSTGTSRETMILVGSVAVFGVLALLLGVMIGRLTSPRPEAVPALSDKEAAAAIARQALGFSTPSATTKPGPTFEPFDEPQTIDGLELGIDNVKVGHLQFLELSTEKLKTMDKLTLIVAFHVTNKTTDRRFKYAGARRAKLVDDRHNNYEEPYLEGLFIDTTRSSTYLDPGAVAHGVVIFEPPLRTAKTLRLSIGRDVAVQDSANPSESELAAFRFSIPMSAVAR
jgi:hypothetical protein